MSRDIGELGLAVEWQPGLLDGDDRQRYPRDALKTAKAPGERPGPFFVSSGRRTPSTGGREA